jgi:adenylate cyclase, class 2
MTSCMHFEVEQKFRIENSTALENRLRTLGAVETETVEQVDRYFNHPARDFAQTDEALRLRRIGELNFVTYKGPKLDATTKTRRELELPLTSGTRAAEEFGELLLALGFRSVAEVRKLRRQLQLTYQNQTVEIALDDVENVGHFAELEISADETEAADAKQCIASLAAELALTNNERRSYLELLLERTTSSRPA